MRVNLFIVLLTFSVSVFAGPDIKHWQTSNGAKVLYVNAPALPMVDISVVFDAGSARDGDLPGTALMTNGMLAEGAGEWSSDQIAERFESVGANFGNTSRKDMSIVSLRTLTDEAWLNKAVETFSVVLSKPNFPKKAFERERKRLLISLEQKKQSPDAIADEAFYSALFGDHPYAIPSDGTEKSVTKMSTDDLKAFYQRYFVGSNATVAIVGDLSKGEAANLAERVVGNLPKGKPAEKLPKVKSLLKREREVIEFPSQQTHVQVGQPGITRDDPDYFPLYVGNHILGGSGLVSRISNEVREKRGLAYSAYSYFIPMREQGPFIMGLQTRNDQADEALKVLRNTLQDFIDNGPSADELTASKKNITGGFALRVDSNSKIVSYLASIGFYDLPLDYLDTFIGKVEAVTLEQIKDAFQRRLNPNKMVTVMVGGASEEKANAAN